MLVYDMREPFIISDLVNDYSLKVEYRFGDPATTGMNLINHWSKISLQHIILFQRDSYDHFVYDEDIFSCECNLDGFVNSFDGALIHRTEGKYETLYEFEQGRITYLNIAFDEMFNISSFVITSLHDFVNKISKDGVAKIRNKNVLDMTQQMNDVYERLAESKELPRMTPVHVLTGLTR